MVCHRGRGQLAEKSHKNEALKYRSASRSDSELLVSLVENCLGGVEGPETGPGANGSQQTQRASAGHYLEKLPPEMRREKH